MLNVLDYVFWHPTQSIIKMHTLKKNCWSILLTLLTTIVLKQIVSLMLLNGGFPVIILHDYVTPAEHMYLTP